METFELRFVKTPTAGEKYLMIAIGNQHGDIYRLIGVGSQANLAIFLKALQHLNLSGESKNGAHVCGKSHMILSWPFFMPVRAGGSTRVAVRRRSVSVL
ncbi:hypothetical protein [Herbaspirillum robiniae]|uniref:hypothetical protein n=1 Tax=Herbaspirillum robiniae TaxID=2014887 RepID=UPI0011E4CBD9|nr:hypothetical protein [Herbaspirillum robiniae]